MYSKSLEARPGRGPSWVQFYLPLESHPHLLGGPATPTKPGQMCESWPWKLRKEKQWLRAMTFEKTCSVSVVV